MSLSPEAKAQRQYKRLLMYEQLSLPNWRLMSETLWEEVLNTKGARVQGLPEEEIKKRHPTIDTIIVAELFPDSNDDDWINTAQSERLRHEDLRSSGDPEETRISAEIMIIKGRKYCSLNPILLSTSTTHLPTKSNLNQVVEMLLEAGYIPLDTEMNVIPLDIPLK